VAPGADAGARDGAGLSRAHPRQPLISETLRLEETRFRNTLERGLAILDEETRTLKKGDKLKGEVAFTLYDTFGFSARSHGRRFEIPRHRGRHRGFRRRHGAPAREGARLVVGLGRGRDRDRLVRVARPGRRHRIPRYETEGAEGVVAALVRDGQEVDALKKGESGAVVLNQSPFYAESGGQVGDTGVMTADGVRFRRHRHGQEGGRRLRPYRRRRGGHPQERPGARARGRS